MKATTEDQNDRLDQLQQQIRELEKRITQLEAGTARNEPSSYIRVTADIDEDVQTVQRVSGNQSESVESRIGEYGMAWIGNFVLLFGILFLTQFLRIKEQELLSLVLGVSLTAAVYLAGHFTRSSFPYLSRLFGFNGHLLLFMIAMQVYLLPGNRLTDNAVFGEGIVIAVIAVMLYLTYRRQSQVLAVIAWIMAVVAAIASNQTHLMLILMVAVAWSAVFFTYRFNWWPALITSIVLVYFSFLVWILGDPFVTHNAGVITSHQYSYLYLFACAMAYTFLTVLPRSDRFKEGVLNAAILLNGLGFSTILVISVLAFFPDNYFLLFGVIAACCMGFAVWLQSRGDWERITALYALYGFIALSICIAGAFHFPRAFLLLALQSLLVVSVALWFRSRFMVIMNTFLVIGLLITYLALPGNEHSINFTFAGVALVTARVLNWKKKRLEIQTELIRNIYLFTGASMLLFSLHEAVPAHFISLSWVLSAVVFFMLSLLLHNIKYRWLAIGTVIVTVFYVFIVDLKSISLGYRIIALMLISVISLGISIFYSKRLKK
ncbi:MAG: hypothetical protein ACWGNV_03955 [Bacteroidales bacterium]